MLNLLEGGILVPDTVTLKPNLGQRRCLARARHDARVDQVLPREEESGGEEEAIETLVRHVLLEWPEVEDPIRSYGYFLPSKLGMVMEKNLPDRREPWTSNMMIRFNLPRKFFERISPWLVRKNKGKERAFSLEIKDINENFNTNLGKELQLKGVQRIYTRFRINENGNIVDIESRANSPELIKEAERVVSLLPQVTPGRHRGKNVSVLYALPIVFQTK